MFLEGFFKIFIEFLIVLLFENVLFVFFFVFDGFLNLNLVVNFIMVLLLLWRCELVCIEWVGNGLEIWNFFDNVILFGIVCVCKLLFWVIWIVDFLFFLKFESLWVFFLDLVELIGFGIVLLYCEGRDEEVRLLLDFFCVDLNVVFCNLRDGVDLEGVFWVLIK